MNNRMTSIYKYIFTKSNNKVAYLTPRVISPITGDVGVRHLYGTWLYEHLSQSAKGSAYDLNIYANSVRRSLQPVSHTPLRVGLCNN